jgi:hypothetical protein
MAGASVSFCGRATSRVKRGGELGVWCGQRHVEERGGKAQARSRHADGGRRGPCLKAWAGRGKEGAGPGPREQCQF